ncbi:MAG: hypothetical protein H6814_08965 [Phycisphaeraceae bacterium]|nr:hypothetical protein [Phycisphaeraceae bacterium]
MLHGRSPNPYGGGYRSQRLRRAVERARSHGTPPVAGSRAMQPWPGGWPPMPHGAFCDGPCLLGFTPDGRQLRINEDDLNGPVTLVVGPPRSGKTVLAERLMATVDALGGLVIGVDTKNASDHEPGHGLPTLVPRDLALGLEPPPGVDEEVFLGRWIRLIEQSLYLHSGSRYLLEEWRKLRLALAPGERVCWRAVLEALELRLDKAKGWSKQSQHLDSAVNALGRLCRSTELFSSVVGLDWRRRFSHSHTILLRGQTAEAARIATLIYLEAFPLYATAMGWTDRRFRGLFVLDDARVLVKRGERHDHADVDALINFADLAHVNGAGTMVVVQHLGEVSDDLVSSANGLILCGPVSEQDIARLRGRMQLTPLQTQWLLHQPVFYAVAHFRRQAWSFGVPIRLAPPSPTTPAGSFAGADRERRRRAMFDGMTPKLWAPAPISASSTATSSTASTERSGNGDQDSDEKQGLSAKLHRLLTELADHPHLLQSELGQRCGVRGRELTACRDELQQLGLVRTHRLLRYALWELTQKGAERIGRRFIPLAGRGSHSHRFMQARWAAWKRRACPRVEVEHEIPGVGPVDGYAETAEGAVEVVEIVLSEETVDRAIEKLVKVDGVRTIVVTDQDAVQRIRRRVGDLAGIGVLSVRELVAIGQCSS